MYHRSALDAVEKKYFAVPGIALQLSSHYTDRANVSPFKCVHTLWLTIQATRARVCVRACS